MEKLKVRYPVPPKALTLDETITILRALEAEGLIQLVELPDEQFFSWPTEAGRCRLKELWEDLDDVGALVFDYICRVSMKNFCRDRHMSVFGAGNSRANRVGHDLE